MGMNQDEAQPQGPRRRLAADRRAARRRQRALGPARRRARALPDGQRRPAVVGRLPRRRAQPAGAAASSRAATCTGTCPKVIEHFGGAEVYRAEDDDGVGRHQRRLRHPADAQRAPLLHPQHDARRRRRRLRAPAAATPAPTARATTGAPARSRANPMPSTQMVNVIRLAMRDWVMNGTPPPPSRYPTLTGGTLVDPTKAAMGFPSRRSRRSRLDLPARELRLPGLRLRLGAAIQRAATRPASRPTCRRRSAR